MHQVGPARTRGSDPNLNPYKKWIYLVASQDEIRYRDAEMQSKGLFPKCLWKDHHSTAIPESEAPI